MIGRYSAATVVTAAFVVAILSGHAGSQPFYSVIGKERIPRGYKSWSIFLVTNQDWLVPEKADQIIELYRQAEAFGRTIGGNHLAVWFWKQNQPGSCCERVPHNRKIPGTLGVVENIDVERAIAFCEKLGLKPSRGPYLLFTTTYPDEQDTLTNYSVVELGKEPQAVQGFLGRLGDQLIVEGVVRNGLFASAAGTDDFWSAWFDATRHAIASLGLRFRVAIRTPTISLDAGDR